MDVQPQWGSEAEAAHGHALHVAEKPGAPADWNAALDGLQRSAALGHGLAQAELAALARDWALARAILAGEAVGPANWESLRRSIDLGPWLTPPSPRILCASPRIATAEGMAPPELCDWLIARARSKLEPAGVYDLETGRQRVESVRTNSACYFPF